MEKNIEKLSIYELPPRFKFLPKTGKAFSESGFHFLQRLHGVKQ